MVKMTKFIFCGGAHGVVDRLESRWVSKIRRSLFDWQLLELRTH